MEVLIRTACPEDAGALLNIYAYYVRETAVNFEYEVPSLEEFRGRMERTLSRYPYLVAMQEDRILGYACAGPFKERDAYDWSVETTIYLDRDARREGIGSLLLDELEPLLKRQGILNVYACIGIPREDQEHIFERFYRVDKARSRDTGGTGLGLSIVRQMVKMHGGSISVNSEPGKGSEFVVTFPAEGEAS